MKENLLVKWFKPTKRAGGLLEITAEDLLKMGVEVIALDADNTSSFDRSTTPIPGAVEWVESMKNAGLKVMLLSNGKASRAGILAAQYDIPVIGLSFKPMPFGYIRAMLKYKKPASKFVMIGDQVFTDIWGANLVGFKSICCKQAGPDVKQKLGFAIKRFIERVVLWYIYEYKKA